MDNHQPQARQSNKRAAFVLQMVLLFLMMALSGLIGLIWFGGERLLFPPTPTATATTGARVAPTADFRATLIAEDVATQEAYSTLAVELGLSPLVAPTKPSDAVAIATTVITQPVIIDPGAPATAIVPPDGTVNGGTQVNISLPIMANASILPTPTLTPIVFSELPTETPTITPTATFAALPTETPTPLPPTPTLTPTPTFFVLSQRAVIVATPLATLRTGPSNLNSAAETLPWGTVINLTGRDETGEWVQILWNNTPRWLRQVYAPPKENQLQPGAPAGSNANDIRWLRVDVAPPTTVPILTPTAIPDNTFPRYRRDRANSGRMPKLPTWPLTQVWPNPNRADQPMISPIVVANDKVFVTSGDNHLYALGAAEGNQQWRLNVGAPVRLAPSIQENIIYLVDAQRRTMAVSDQGSQGVVLWQGSLQGDALTSLYPYQNRLFVIARDSGNAEHLYSLDRNNGALGPTYNPTTDIAPALTIGNQLLYIGDPDLRALDMNDLTVIWTRDDIENLQAPPVYMLNGPNALAELYVVDSSASGVRLHALNANTGQSIWTTAIGREVSGLAVDDNAVYVTGNNYMRAIVRQGGNATQWEIGISGQAIGGPLVDGSQILVVTASGIIQAININGQTIGSQLLPNGLQVNSAPAVVGPYLYISTNDSIVYAYRGQP